MLFLDRLPAPTPTDPCLQWRAASISPIEMFRVEVQREGQVRGHRAKEESHRDPSICHCYHTQECVFL